MDTITIPHVYAFEFDYAYDDYPLNMPLGRGDEHTIQREKKRS